MTIYAVTYAYSDDEALRDAERATHRAYLAGLDELVISGPWGAQEAPGALLIFRAEAPERVSEIVAADPFVLVGAVTDHTIREWLPVLGPVKDAFTN